jgi:hypothetical protein
METYSAETSDHGRYVTVDGQSLPAFYSNQEATSVPFDWGNESPRAARLARAILFKDAGKEAARLYAQDFMIEVVSKLPTSSWSFTSAEIAKWIKLKRQIWPSINEACSGNSHTDAAPPAKPLEPSDFPNFPVDTLKNKRP